MTFSTEEFEDNQSGQNLPILALRRIFDYLDDKHLKISRFVCRFWNNCLISSRYLSHMVDFHFDLKTLCTASYQRKSVLSRIVSPKDNRRHISIKNIHWLQQSYVENIQSYGMEVDPMIRILGLDKLPEFGTLISQDFNDMMTNASYLHLSADDCKSKICSSHLNAIVERLLRVRKLKISSNLLFLINGLEEDCTTKFFQFMNGIVDLHIVIQKGVLKVEEVYFIWDLFGSKYVESVKRLSIIRHSTEGKPCDEVNWDTALPYIFDSDRGKVLISPVRLTHLTLDIAGLPASIFGNMSFRIILLTLELRGLQHLSLKLEGTSLPTYIPSTIQTMATNGRCQVTLDLKINYADMTNHFDNNFVLSLPDLSKSLEKLTLSFKKEFNSNAGNDAYCLRQFIPKRERLIPLGAPVTFNNLRYLCIEMEAWTPKVFLDFSSIVSACPLLTELRCIEGQGKSCSSRWTTWTNKFRNIPEEGMICSWHIRWIMECFSRLKTLVIWSRMGDVKDSTFIWERREIIPGLSSTGSISTLLPCLETVSLRGVGKLVTDGALDGFYGLMHLKNLEITGNHKISSTGKQKLLRNVTSLQTFTYRTEK